MISAAPSLPFDEGCHLSILCHPQQNELLSQAWGVAHVVHVRGLREGSAVALWLRGGVELARRPVCASPFPETRVHSGHRPACALFTVLLFPDEDHRKLRGWSGGSGPTTPRVPLHPQINPHVMKPSVPWSQRTAERPTDMRGPEKSGQVFSARDGMHGSQSVRRTPTPGPGVRLPPRAVSPDPRVSSGVPTLKSSCAPAENAALKGGKAWPSFGAQSSCSVLIKNVGQKHACGEPQGPVPTSSG